MLITLLALTLPTAVALGSEGALVTIGSDAPVAAQWIGAPASGKLTFRVGETQRTIETADLVRWGALVEPGESPQVVLAGGDCLMAADVTIVKERLRVDSDLLGIVDLPLEITAGIVLRPPLVRAARDRWIAQVLNPGGEADRVLLDNGDALSGTILGMTEEKLRLQTDGGEIEIERKRLVAMMFNPTLVGAPRVTGTRLLVGLKDGSLLTAVDLTVEGETALLKLPGAVTCRVPWDAIIALQSLGGRAVYLSDLKPASFRHLPYLQLAWPLRIDRSVLDSRLRAEGHPYSKGLGMHSPARVTYDLDRPFQRFEALAAIDDEAGLRGSVVFRVFTDDGSGSWQSRYVSPVVRGGDAPIPISVDLSGAKRISLLVDFADHGDELDHADWLDARLIP